MPKTRANFRFLGESEPTVIFEGFGSVFLRAAMLCRRHAVYTAHNNLCQSDLCRILISISISQTDMSDTNKLTEEEREKLVADIDPEFPKYTTQIMNTANQNSQGTRPKVGDSLVR